MEMNNIPTWLPELFSVSPWKESTYDELYNVFLNDFQRNKLSYLTFNVWFFPEQDDSKYKLFWHITSSEDKTLGDRIPDLRRCERLPWIRPMILNCPDSSIKNWDYEEGDGKIKTYVWLEDLDFVVIMKRYNDEQRRLVTSFHLDYSNAKRKMKRKYENRI